VCAFAWLWSIMGVCMFLCECERKRMCACLVCCLREHARSRADMHIRVCWQSGPPAGLPAGLCGMRRSQCVCVRVCVRVRVYFNVRVGV